MKKRFSRREFLEAGLVSSIAMGAASLPTPITARPSGKPKTPLPPPPQTTGLNRGQLLALRAALDEIIPAADGMPSASEAGGAKYLEELCRRDPAVYKLLARSLAALEKASRRQSGKSFAQLERAERVKALAQLEKTAPARLFVTLRDFTYESYYTQPRAWKLIGYEFHPTDGAGPTLQPFDESVLAQARKKPRYYREVD